MQLSITVLFKAHYLSLSFNFFGFSLIFGSKIFIFLHIGHFTFVSHHGFFAKTKICFPQEHGNLKTIIHHSP